MKMQPPTRLGWMNWLTVAPYNELLVLCNARWRFSLVGVEVAMFKAGLISTSDISYSPLNFEPCEAFRNLRRVLGKTG